MEYCPKCGSICTKFLSVMQCKVTHHMKNSQKLSEKLILWLILRCFSFTPSFAIFASFHPFTSPIFSQIKGLIRYKILVIFISKAFVVINFFLTDSASVKWSFCRGRGCWALIPPDMF